MVDKLAEITSWRDRQKEIRRVLGRMIRSHLSELGGDIAGFALVTWDMRGSCCSGTATSHGPISRTLAPAFVHDALNRHVAVVVAQENQHNRIDGDA